MATFTHLSADDLAQLEREGRDIDETTLYYRRLAAGTSWTRLVRPARIGNGILRMEGQDLERLERGFASAVEDGHVMSFIPASGAATRFAASLITAHRTGEISEEVKTILENIGKFAFWEKLQEYGARFDNPHSILEALVGETGMRIGNLPKGLVPFHSYPDADSSHDSFPTSKTAFAEQIAEAVALTTDAQGRVRMRFTISPEHRSGFETELHLARSRFPNVNLDVEFVEQSPQTDTPALEMDGTPARTRDGRLLFRPGGHGALLQQLQECPSPIALIKNIDNVVAAPLRPEVLKWRRWIGGLLVDLQREVAGCALGLESGHAISRARDFLRHTLHVDFGTGRRMLFEQLNRPWRVCGMVRNDGQPGGGPFWARNRGDTSLQIVESAQVNHMDPEQQKIFWDSTHFNPVEMAVSLRNTHWLPYDLSEFVDYNAAIICKKVVDGREVRIIEHPGLWNGSMAGWNTVFVEMPLATFAPVKTLTDLLHDAHRG